jgi:hypothetical protein
MVFGFRSATSIQTQTFNRGSGKGRVALCGFKRRPRAYPTKPTNTPRLEQEQHCGECGRSHAVLRRNAQAQVDVARHRVALHDLDPLLPTQLPRDPSDLFRKRPLDHPATIFPSKHNVVLAVPFYMGLTLPISHGDLLRVWRIARSQLLHPNCTPERQSLGESTDRGGGLPVVSHSARPKCIERHPLH